MNNDKYLQAFEENHGQYTSLEDLERAKSFLLSALIAKEEEVDKKWREKIKDRIGSHTPAYEEEDMYVVTVLEDLLAFIETKR